MRHISITLFAILLPLAAFAADNVIPHAQDEPPGPPPSPAEAMAKMKVPEGFQVELVASEPDLVNPVAFTFDETQSAGAHGVPREEQAVWLGI